MSANWDLHIYLQGNNSKFSNFCFEDLVLFVFVVKLNFMVWHKLQNLILNVVNIFMPGRGMVKHERWCHDFCLFPFISYCIQQRINGKGCCHYESAEQLSGSVWSLHAGMLWLSKHFTARTLSKVTSIISFNHLSIAYINGKGL